MPPLAPVERRVLEKKLEGNMCHDREVTALFEARGWTVQRIWECELLKMNLPATTEKIMCVLYRCKEEKSDGSIV